MSLGMDSINALACPFTITALSTVQTPQLAGLWQVSQSPRCEVFRRSILNPGRARHQGRERESDLKLSLRESGNALVSVSEERCVSVNAPRRLKVHGRV